MNSLKKEQQKTALLIKVIKSYTDITDIRFESDLLAQDNIVSIRITLDDKCEFITL